MSFCADAPEQATEAATELLRAMLDVSGAQCHDAGPAEGAVAALHELVAWCTRPQPPSSPEMALFTATDPAGGAGALALVTPPEAPRAARPG